MAAMAVGVIAADGTATADAIDFEDAGTRRRIDEAALWRGLFFARPYPPYLPFLTHPLRCA
jgi:hypothetical protein